MTLSKTTMQRSKLKSIFLKNRTQENGNNFVKKRNLRVTLFRKSKREIFGNLSEKNLCDNKKFRCEVKPLLSNKVVSDEKLTHSRRAGKHCRKQ